MRVPTVLWRSLRVLGRNLAPCGLLSVITLAPVLAALAVKPAFRAPGIVELFFIAATLLVFLLPGAVTPTIMRSLDDERGAGTPWLVGGFGLVRALPVSLVMLVGVVGTMWIGGVFVMFMFFPLVLGMAVGFWMWSCWWVAAPSQMVERSGTFRALARSHQLTRGANFSILAILLLSQLVRWGVQIGLFYALDHGSVYVIASLLLHTLANAYDAVCSVVGYHTLRR